MQWLLTWLGGLLGGPFITAALEAYKAKLTSENSITAAATDLAGRELALQVREAELQTDLRKAQIGKWYEPEHIIGYALAFFYAKCVVWDTALGLGTTPALRGDVATWSGLVIVCYFGKRGIENVVRIWKTRG